MSIAKTLQVVLLGLLGWSLQPNHSAAAADPAPPTAETGYLKEVPPDLVDPAFTELVDLKQLQQAIRSLDRKMLLAQAVQFAKAERRVGREHKAVSSDAIFKLLLRASVDSRDRESLESAAKAIEELDKKDLMPLIEPSRKLAAAPRKLDLGDDVPRKELSAQGIVLYNTLKEQVRVARVVGDADVVRELREQITELEGLHPKHRAYLERLADDSLVALAAKPELEQVALSRLTGFSRATPKK